MKPVLLATVLFLLLAEPTFPDGPPLNMHDHFTQCGEAKTASEALACYENFWRKYCPTEDGGVATAGSGYGDGSHVIRVRLCAYRLLGLYIAAHDQQKTKQFLQWLEDKDPVIGSMPARLRKHPPP